MAPNGCIHLDRRHQNGDDDDIHEAAREAQSTLWREIQLWDRFGAMCSLK